MQALLKKNREEPDGGEMNDYFVAQSILNILMRLEIEGFPRRPRVNVQHTEWLIVRARAGAIADGRNQLETAAQLISRTRLPADLKDHEQLAKNHRSRALQPTPLVRRRVEVLPLPALLTRSRGDPPMAPSPV